MWLVSTLVPPPSAAEQEQALLNAQAELHALGITAWQDAVVEPETLAAYLAVAGRGQLTMRAEGNLLWDRSRGEEQIDDLLEMREQGSLGRLRIRGVKIFQDGVLENFTGSLLEPYEGTDNRGMSMHEAEELRRMLVLLDSHGFQVHLHTIGDRAVRESLDAIEGGSAGERPARRAPPPRAHPADPSRRPAAVRRARRRRERTAVLGRAQPLRRRSHPSVHRRARRLPLPVREPRPRRGAARLRERLDRLDGEPASDRRGRRHADPASRAGP